MQSALSYRVFVSGAELEWRLHLSHTADGESAAGSGGAGVLRVALVKHDVRSEVAFQGGWDTCIDRVGEQSEVIGLHMRVCVDLQPPLLIS